MAATRKMKQSELMISAATKGEAAVQRVQESRTRNRQQTLSREARTDQQELDRWQRQWEVQRRQRGLADAERASNQAAKADTTIFGGKGRRERAAAEQDRVTDREKFDESKRQFDESQGLEAAKAGLKEKGEGGAKPSFKDHAPTSQTPRDISKVVGPEQEGDFGGYVTPGGPDRTGAQASMDPRMQQLDQEMNQRGQVQMGQPLELGTQGSGWVADPSTPAARTALAKQQTAELQLIKQQRSMGLKVQEAQAKVDAASTKEAKALLKETEEKAQARIANFSDRYNKFDESQTLGADQPTHHQWEQLAEMVKGKDFLPPEIHQAIKDKRANARLVGWMAEKRARMAVEYVANGNGELPDREYVDFMTEGMKEFMDQVQAAREETNYKFGGPAGLFSTATRARQRRIVQKMAAKAILDRTTMTQGPGGGAGTPADASADSAAAGGAATAQMEGSTGGAMHASLPNPTGMDREQRAGQQSAPNQMGEQVAQLGEPRKWSEVQ